ncbi:MAG: hypothetical protein QF860_15970 [Planctomycetota bacterium]|jgi:hypothetical protein|nr:hypothetical protein [Planctomycetota bacterium]
MASPLRRLGGVLAAWCALGGALAIALAPAGPGAAGRNGEKPVLAPFRGDLDAARRSASERNVPLIYHVILEGEEQNDEYRDRILPHKELVALSERAVVIVSNNGQHKLKRVTEKVEGGTIERQVCSVYPMFENCHQHRAVWDALYHELKEDDGNLHCPQIRIFRPDGEELYSLASDPPAASTVLAQLKRAQREAGPGLTEGEHLRTKRALADGARCLSGKLWPQAWRAHAGVLEILEQGAFADEARAGAEAALAGLDAELAELGAQLVPGKAAAAYARLVVLTAECADTPRERAVADLVRKAERKREIKEEIETWKLEQSAERMWSQALALLADEQKRKAERLFRRLLRKKYAATPAGLRAAERFPEWAAEERASGK